MRKLLVTVWIAVLFLGAGAAVRFGAEAGILIPAALPLGLIPILGLCWLRPGEERVGWTVFTIWLGLKPCSSGFRS